MAMCFFTEIRPFLAKVSAPRCNVSASPPICSTRKGSHHPATEEWHRSCYLRIIVAQLCSKGKMFPYNQGCGEQHRTQYIMASVCWPYKILKFWLWSMVLCLFLLLRFFCRFVSFDWGLVLCFCVCACAFCLFSWFLFVCFVFNIIPVSFSHPLDSLQLINHIKQLILSKARRSVDQSSTRAKVAETRITNHSTWAGFLTRDKQINSAADTATHVAWNNPQRDPAHVQEKHRVHGWHTASGVTRGTRFKSPLLLCHQSRVLNPSINAASTLRLRNAESLTHKTHWEREGKGRDEVKKLINASINFSNVTLNKFLLMRHLFMG